MPRCRLAAVGDYSAENVVGGGQLGPTFLTRSGGFLVSSQRVASVLVDAITVSCAALDRGNVADLVRSGRLKICTMVWAILA